MIQHAVTNDLATVVALHPKDGTGKDRNLDGPAAYTSSDPTKVTVVNVSADGLNATIMPTDDAVGVFQINVADVDNDPSEVIEMTYSLPAAKSLGIVLTDTPKSGVVVTP